MLEYLFPLAMLEITSRMKFSGADCRPEAPVKRQDYVEKKLGRGKQPMVRITKDERRIQRRIR